MARLVKVALLVLVFPLVLFPQDKDQKKQLEAKAKIVVDEGKALEKQDRLLDARAKFAEAQGVIPTKDATGGLNRVNGEIQKRVRNYIKEARASFEGAKYQDAIATLNRALELQPGNPAINYNLALCYAKLDDKEKAVEYLSQASASVSNEKDKQALEELKVALITGETINGLNDVDKGRIRQFNELSLKLESRTLGEDTSDSSPSAGKKSDAIQQEQPPTSASGVSDNGKISLCDRLNELRPTLPQSPAVVFNLARCAEQEGKTEESVRLFNQYLQIAPNAVDSPDVQLQVEDLNSLVAISDSKGAEVRSLYASASRELDARRYDRALDAYRQAETIAPNFPQTKWRLGLMYEMFGNVEKAREYFASYKSLAPTDAGKADADTHLNGLNEKATIYKQKINEAGSVLSSLLRRWVGIEEEGGRPVMRSGGNSGVPFDYAQEQLDAVSKSLQVAHSIFPLAPEVNAMLGFVYLQGSNGSVAQRHFDAVAGQKLPVSFYGSIIEAKDRKAIHNVKLELDYDTLRLVDLAVYDPKQKSFHLPGKPAGSDNLGNLFHSASIGTAGFDGVQVKMADLKKVGTENNTVKFSFLDKEITFVPLNLTGLTPYDGAPARKFANTYTRLFRDYLGIEDAKLGKEGMTGSEKFFMGLEMATAGMSAYSAFASMGTMMNSTQLLALSNALNASASTLQRSKLQQRQILRDNQFKLIPAEPFQLTYREDLR